VLRARFLVPNKHVRDLLVLLGGNGVQDACTCSIESDETGIALNESFVSGDHVQEVVLLFIPFLETSLQFPFGNLLLSTLVVVHCASAARGVHLNVVFIESGPAVLRVLVLGIIGGLQQTTDA
jgi:hypothetical protein